MQLQLQLIRTYIAQFSMEHDQMRFTSSYKTSRFYIKPTGSFLDILNSASRILQCYNRTT